MNVPILHGYFRSTASWRVRLALNLKAIEYDQRSIHLRDGGQFDPAFLARNPQGFVPMLEIDGELLTQSLAIIDYLDETRPTTALLPSAPADRAQIRAFAQIIACDTHPIQNLKIMKRVIALTGKKDDGPAWARTTIEEGFAACEAMLAKSDQPYCFGEAPTLADILLIPQIANARRFDVDMTAFPTLVRIDAHCKDHPAFVKSAPENQPDFEA